MSIDWIEFSAIAIVHLFAVASPGPDLAVVIKQSLQQGRHAAIVTSIGVGTGILVHVAYSLLGISIVIKTTPWLFELLIYGAALYLFYIGISALRSGPTVAPMSEAVDTPVSRSIIRNFSLGFITNGLNPKATLFFLSVFTVLIAPDTAITTKAFYGVYMAIATACWFTLVSCVISHSRIRAGYLKHSYWFDRAMGASLILIAALMLFTK